MAKKIFVAATRQHVGKTTSTLGIVAAIKNKGLKVAYSKPVGQQWVDIDNDQVDKDTVLFSSVMHFDISSEIHSPVILGKGATSAYIENPDNYHYKERLIAAAKHLEENYDVVVYEGTGHPGVGSVVDLSNADVAKILNSGVVMIVEGGIGNTIDEFNRSVALFRIEKVPIIGVIINKVRVDKMEKVEYFVGKKLNQMGIPLLGVIPYDKSMSFPIMSTIKNAVKGKVLLNADNLSNSVEELISGSLIEMDQVNSASNLLLVVSHMRMEKIFQDIWRLLRKSNSDNCPLSGIIITGDDSKGDDVHPLIDDNVYIEKYKIPVISTSLDTIGAVVKISDIEVKINTETPWKSKKAIELINEYVDLDRLLELAK